jgi:hypothetical protein
MTTAGDLAALLGQASVRTASATLRRCDDPLATLRAWSAAGPWQAEAAAGDPAALGLPPTVTTEEWREWVDRPGDRAREEHGALVTARSGDRWWRTLPTVAEGEGALDVAATLSRWIDPQPLTRVLELVPAGEAWVLRRPALRVLATARGDSFAGPLAPLGWGAARWELLVDSKSGALLGTRAFTADGAAFRRVEAVALVFDEPLDAALFARPA